MHRFHTQIVKSEELRIVALGGTGVTKNMFVYELRSHGFIKDILIVDCGIGFPEPDMYGIDFLIPDTRYLIDKKQYIRGIMFTHGHDDHIGAIPYVFEDLGKPRMFGTTLTAAFANVKLAEAGIRERVKPISFQDKLTLGQFRISCIRMTHSIPDTTCVVIDTPIGTVVHASDFKFDFTPLDNKLPELDKINAVGKAGVLCMLTDCLGSERRGFTQSEQVTGQTLDAEMRLCRGKFLFTTTSSNISRIQLVIDIARKYNRRVGFVGRSIEENIDAALRLGYITIPHHMLMEENEFPKEDEARMCLVVSGSQGQPDSAMTRIAHDNHKLIRLSTGDTVVFSADPIPGNELTVQRIIDQLFRKGVRVSYSNIMEGLHVSGHGSQGDLMLLLSAINPKYVLPIGGTYRHTMMYAMLASELGFPKDHVLLPEDGEVVALLPNQKPRIVESIDIDNIMVDGLGIGDVGKAVLRDRQTIAEHGIVVIVIPIDQSTGRVTSDPDVISRGFVFMKESSSIIDTIKKTTADSLILKKGRIIDWGYVRTRVIRRVEKVLAKETGRYPLIVPIILEV